MKILVRGGTGHRRRSGYRAAQEGSGGPRIASKAAGCGQAARRRGRAVSEGSITFQPRGEHDA
jgi:hypothetical protein